MKPFFMYMLKCNDGSYYIGHTDDIDKRIAEHTQGKINGYTKKRLPVKIVYVQNFMTRDEAINAERQIKGWSRKKKEALLRDDWEKIKELSNN
ncbi:MAG TPA: GIY-YIG nuclease family protein [Candidatus Babeliales bacterium]|jgi:predicted GIY-YIG superfamily endonuclease|nr:GIY-YIG nuclease family protein [Candidatus Babeliales bacterium]